MSYIDTEWCANAGAAHASKKQVSKMADFVFIDIPPNEAFSRPANLV
jgi:hypothetical protein